MWGSADKMRGRAYIDALIAAGFTDTSAMQLTSDTTTVGNEAETMLFSVLVKGKCLVGQVGQATGNPVTEVAAPLGDGVCLLGKTVPVQ
ncbi:DUF6993 domain-containing protein [Microbacterium gorillae]|uniref:DUF6993 domain-containing protein n=1 Tax=Microbacterium gorillae TaxID=1231063 RepID=UPI0006943B81|nr:hypothetical protein [Microbacterium gorillae]